MVGTMNLKHFIKISIFIIFLSQPMLVLSQSKVGTTVGQFLKIEPSARGTALGNASTSLYGEAATAFYNPASIGRLQKSNVQFTHSNWLADIDYNFVIVALNIGNLGTMSLQAISLNSGEIDVRTVEQPMGTGERYSVTNFALGLGYARMLTDRVSVGMIINYLRETIWHSNAAGVALNFGVQYKLSHYGLNLGASVANFGPRMKYSGRDLFIDYDFYPDKYGDNDNLPAELRTDAYQLPTIFRFGMSYPVRLGDNNRILIAVDAKNPSDNTQSLNLGVEWKILDRFALRGGYRDLFLKDSEGGLVFGAGMQLEYYQYNLMFDYAWADYGRLEQTHRFTLGLGF